MAKLLKLRRGTTTQHSSFTGAEGEVTVDTDKETLVVHDGSTAGGHPVAAEDLANVSSSTIAGRLSNDSLAVSKIAAGTLPSDVKIQDANISGNLTIATADINNDAVTQAKIADDAVGGAQLVNGSVTSVAIGSDAVTTAKIADQAVTLAKLEHGTSSNNGKFLRANNGADPTFEVVNTDLVADTSPQLGGDLDFNGNNALLQGPGGNVNTNWDNDSWEKILFDNSYNSSAQGPNKIVLQNDNNWKAGFGLAADEVGMYSGGDIAFYGNTTDSTASTKETLAKFISDGAVELYHNNSKKIETTSSGISVSGDIAVSGTVDGVDVATRDTLFGGLTSSSGVLTNGVTATTQGTSDNSTKVATTAYVTTAVGNAEPFPSGTKMIFQQTSAPTGWTKVTSSVDNKALRIVSGSVSSGGNQAFTSAFASRTPAGSVGASGNSTASFSGSVSSNTGNAGASTSSVSTSGNVNNHTLSNSQMPSHSHSFTMRYQDYYDNYHAPQRTSSGSSGSANQNTNNSGGSNAHSHGFSGSSHSHNVNNHFHSFSANFSGNTGNHTHNAGSFSGTAMDFAVQYIDVIIATKD